MMSASVERFPFVERDPALGAASLAPMLPLTLSGVQSRVTSGLVDTGAAVNVLPFTLGTDLGFDWDQLATSIRLSGIVGQPAAPAERYELARTRDLVLSLSALTLRLARREGEPDAPESTQTQKQQA